MNNKYVEAYRVLVIDFLSSMFYLEVPINNKHLYSACAELHVLVILHNKVAVVTKTLVKSIYIFSCTILIA